MYRDFVLIAEKRSSLAVQGPKRVKMLDVMIQDRDSRVSPPHVFVCLVVGGSAKRQQQMRLSWTWRFVGSELRAAIFAPEKDEARGCLRA